MTLSGFVCNPIYLRILQHGLLHCFPGVYILTEHKIVSPVILSINDVTQFFWYFLTAIPFITFLSTKVYVISSQSHWLLPLKAMISLMDDSDFHIQNFWVSQLAIQCLCNIKNAVIKVKNFMDDRHFGH